jgi:hypothetical protein
MFSVLTNQTCGFSGVEQFTLGAKFMCKDHDDKNIFCGDFFKVCP